MTSTKLEKLFKEGKHVFFYKDSLTRWNLASNWDFLKLNTNVVPIALKHKDLAQIVANHPDPDLKVWYKINPEVKDDYTINFFDVYHEDTEYYLEESKEWQDFEVNPMFQKSFGTAESAVTLKPNIEEPIPVITKTKMHNLKQPKRKNVLTQREAIHALVIKGKILFEPTAYTVTFLLFGNWYTTSMKRNKIYKFDNNTWKLATNQGFFHKLRLISTGSVKKIT